MVLSRTPCDSSLHEEHASVAPFGKPQWRTAFTADRVAIETVDGEVVQERLHPRASFDGLRGPDLRPVRDLLLVSIDLSDFRLN
jgi:hypothetical protein